MATSSEPSSFPPPSSSPFSPPQTAATAAAPWRKLFLEHIQTMPAPEFSLATVRKTASPSGTVYSPRARMCMFRGMWAELPGNAENAAERNPADVYEGSDVLTFTTDCRMDKLPELFGVEVADEGEAEEQEKLLRGSGGGAPVEAVFWAKERQTQWRLRGAAYVLGPDVDESPEGKRVVSALTPWMRRKKPAAGDAGSGSGSGSGRWSFSREVTAHFGNLPPLMRGSFRSPPPGVPVALPVGDSRLALGRRVADLGDEAARANFRVVVVVPREVDRCDLSDPERGRRWFYRFADGAWEEVEVWP
ncbi:hypothetical protein AAE478_000449 [Parahypoxylon ruwenzoriense]